MDFHRPRRLLGFLTRNRCSDQPRNNDRQPTNDCQLDERVLDCQPSGSSVMSESSMGSSRDYSMRDDVANSASIYSNDEVALLRVTEQRDILVEELRITKKNLEKEKLLTAELNKRLIMKAISIDCQLTETEDQFKKSKARIDAITRRNDELQQKVRALTIDNEALLKRTAALARRDQIQKATILSSNAEILKLMSTIEAFQERFLSLADAVVTVNDKNKKEMEAELEEIIKPSEDSEDSKDEVKPSEDSEDSNDTSILACQSMTPFEADNITESSSQDGAEDKQSSQDNVNKRNEEKSSPDDVIKSADEKRSSQDDVIRREEEKIRAAQARALKEAEEGMRKAEEEKRKLEEEKQKEIELREEEQKKILRKWQSERNDLFGCIQKLKSNNSDIKSKFLQTLKKHQWKWHKEKEKLLKKIGDLEVSIEEKDAELMLVKTALNEVTRGSRFPEKQDLNQSDTFGTLTTTEDSLSTASSSSSLTLTYSLTETSNNLSRKDKKPAAQKLDIVEPVDLDDTNYGFDVSMEYIDTPPKNNTSNDTD